MWIFLKMVDKNIVEYMRTNWDTVSTRFPYVLDMAACIQDPIYHAEGDVWTHTNMVWKEIQKIDQSDIMALTTLYHDVAKPRTRTIEQRDNRQHIGHPNHSRIGAQMFWRDAWLYDLGTFQEKLIVYRQIRAHQKIFHLWSKSDMLREALQYGVDADIIKLIKFAKADNLGRICPDQQETIDSLSLLEDYVTEEKIGLHRFVNPESRIFYFEKLGRSPDYLAQSPIGSKVIMMCGLPGSGKDTYIETHLHGLPIVSLDAIRVQMKIEHGDNQGSVIQAAYELARDYLRKKDPFIWNSTNLTKSIRAKTIGLFRDYDAHVSIYMTTAPYKVLISQNKNRIAQVPDDAINNMLYKWEPPSLSEVHNIKYIGEYL
jgi:predicted kinase